MIRLVEMPIEPFSTVSARYLFEPLMETDVQMNYQSRKYALLNTDIEVDRHLLRVHKYLRPRFSDHLLEVGCGRGFLTEQVQRVAPDTIGIDLNAEAVSNAVTHRLRVMDAQQLAFRDERFDKIYSFHAIEHIPDLGRAFAEMDRVLKPGGSVLLVYPAEPIRGLYVVPTAIMIFGNPLRARDIHIRALSPRTLRPFLANTSLRIVRSSLQLLLTPQFITVLRKDGGAARQQSAHQEFRERIAESA